MSRVDKILDLLDNATQESSEQDHSLHLESVDHCWRCGYRLDNDGAVELCTRCLAAMRQEVLPPGFIDDAVTRMADALVHGFFQPMLTAIANLGLGLLRYCDDSAISLEQLASDIGVELDCDDFRQFVYEHAVPVRRLVDVYADERLVDAYPEPDIGIYLAGSITPEHYRLIAEMDDADG